MPRQIVSLASMTRMISATSFASHDSIALPRISGSSW
jgi:hypothetical protein